MMDAESTGEGKRTRREKPTLQSPTRKETDMKPRSIHSAAVFRMTALAFTVSASLYLAACGGGGGGSDSSQAVETPAPPQRQMPTSVAVTAAPAIPSFGNTDLLRAENIANAMGSSDGRERVTATAAAIGATGTPVLVFNTDQSVKTVAGPANDFVGVPWAHVQLAGAAKPGHWFSLADLMRTFFQPYAKPRPELSAQDEEEILQGLRNAQSSRNEEVRFFANLISLRSQMLGGPTLDAANIKLSDVRVDAPMAEVIVSRYLRTRLLVDQMLRNNDPRLGLQAPAVQARSLLKAGDGIRAADPPATPVRTPGADCSGDSLSSMAVWIMSKATGGINLIPGLPEAEYVGLFKALLGKLKGSNIVYDEQLAKWISKGSTAAGDIFSMLTLVTAVFRIGNTEATAEMIGGPPLVRNKLISQGHGEARRIKFTVSLLANELSYSDDSILACLAFFSIAFGNNTLLPSPGPVANVRVTIEGGVGFTRNLDTSGTTVLFGPDRVDLKPTTDANGKVEIGVQGRQQRRNFSSRALPKQDFFTLLLSGPVEETSASGLGITLLNDLICVVGGVKSCADTVADLLTHMNWNFGEFEFELKDWEEPDPHPQ